jgi:hypothetical protein
MNESKECHANNNDILSSCLKIINSGANTKQNTHRASSHGKAARSVRKYNDVKAMAVIVADVDSAAYFDDLLQGDC